MDSKVIIVSGATSGIGLATLNVLAAAGHRVVGFGRSEEKVAALLPELQATYGELVELQVLDVRQLNEIKCLVDKVIDAQGRIDGLVNAAGLLQIEKSHKVSLESFERQFDSMVKGSFFLTQSVLPQMLKQKDGLVINLGSVSGLRASPQMAVYGAAKAAIQHLTTSLAAEYANKGIRFLCVNPGPVRTELMDPLMFDMLERKLPLQRVGKPEEVAEMIRYLFTEAASFMTGSSITIDGGAAL